MPIRYNKRNCNESRVVVPFFSSSSPIISKYFENLCEAHTFYLFVPKNDDDENDLFEGRC